MTESILPNNQAAERALIGAVIMGVESIKDIRLDANEFYLERHGWVWDAARAITTRGETVDYVTISSELKARDQLGKIGGDAWLMGVMADCESASNAASPPCSATTPPASRPNSSPSPARCSSSSLPHWPMTPRRCTANSAPTTGSTR
jgi:hypothetical protein